MSANKPLAQFAPTRANTAAVVVVFHPEGDLAGRLRLVQNQVERLIVVSNDNGSMDRLDGLNTQRLIHIQNSVNQGLAAALNVGLTQAHELGFAWCFLFDQDTVVDENLLAGLAEVYSVYLQKDKIGMLVPNYRSFGGVRLAYRQDVVWQIVATAVTSGSLIPLSVIEQLGGMREDFFLEGIDTEFCLRARTNGFHIVATGRPLMTHGAGAAEEHRLFGRMVLVGHHPPWRCFLQYRNLTWILLRYGRTELQWAGATLLAMLKRICLICLFEHQRCAKLRAMLQGVLRGIHGKLGRVIVPM